jgi:predicted ATP-grasp superfamily ATP-dependent carboligase
VSLRPTVLVTDGEQRAALAVVRSVAAAGYPVHVAARRKTSLAGVSRGTSATVVVPDSLEEPGAFVDALASYVRSNHVGVVLPVTDPSLLAVLGARERFGEARIPFPTLDIVRAVSDKSKLAEAAAACGIAFPGQHVAADLGAARALGETLAYPVVIKPARSVGENDGVQVKLGVKHAASRAEYEARVGEMPAAAYPLLMQQRIVGPGVGIFLLVWDGAPVAVFAHRRVRELPPSGGVSVCAESVAADPALVERSRQLLARFGWCGVAMVEYKIDASTGTPYLMEINGRFWGSLQLAIDAGVDFPALLVACALGAAPTALPSFRVGVRGRWGWGEIDHLLHRVRRSDAALSLPPGSPTRMRAIVDALPPWGVGGRDFVWRASDPRPFVHETLRWFRRQ